jgi:hypothetical protein
VATPIGREGLAGLFDRSCRVVLVNDTADDRGATILAAAFAVHHDDDAVHTFAFHGLHIGPGENGTFDDDRPSTAPVVLVEALLRLLLREGAGVTDAYAVASDADQPLRQATFGIKSAEGVLNAEDHPIESAPGFAIFGRAIA